MEDRIINIEKEYNLLKDKYPNLINLNKRILEFHKEKMKFIIKECEKTIVKIKNMDRDITNRQLQLIYLYRHIEDLSL
tara:strand:+ start:108 stop:341 length:234 start_codon:yes stop_codon:yes gene_type:complete